MTWKDEGMNPSKKHSPESFVFCEPPVDTTSEGG